MNALTSRDIDYVHDGTAMSGYFCAPQDKQNLPCIVLIHDAFGIDATLISLADRLAGLGFAVFAADVWGDRFTPASEHEIGPLIGGMVGNRGQWLGRISKAHDVAASAPEVDATQLVSLGYCFGGSSVLEHLRTGGDVRGAVSIHGGLDLLAPDWSGAQATARVLVCTGSDDPMATAPMRAKLEAELSGAEIAWEVQLYSDTKHAFTSQKLEFAPPSEVFAYNPRSAQRAWAATEQFLRELFPETSSVGS